MRTRSSKEEPIFIPEIEKNYKNNRKLTREAKIDEEKKEVVKEEEEKKEEMENPPANCMMGVTPNFDERTSIVMPDLSNVSFCIPSIYIFSPLGITVFHYI